MNENLLNWEITAGDQEPRSADDKKCGDHYIQEGLECHDGDAHRPTPGKNPYWQGGRKGPGDKAKKSGGDGDSKPKNSGGGDDKGSSKPKDDKAKDSKPRDKKEVTPQAKQRQDTQKEQGNAPENFAKQRFDHYSGMMEKAYQDRMGAPLEWNGKRVNELLEMVMRDTAREFSLDSGELGFQDPSIPYHGPLDNPLEPTRPSPKKGYKGRALWRPRTFESPTTTPRDGGSRMESVPPAFEGMPEGLIQKVRELVDKGKGPAKPASKPAEKPSEPSKEKDTSKPETQEASIAADLSWATDPEQDLLALHNSLPPLPQDQATSRPCGEGEDPEQGHCNPNIAPPAPRKAQPQPGPSDSAKFLRKTGGPQAPPPKGVGLGPKTGDEGRKQRTVEHVQNMKKIDPADTKRNAWAVNKMFGGGQVKQTDKGIIGASKPMAPEQAQLQYDDARHSLEQSGWKNSSEMGGRTTWNKGGAQISLISGKDPASNMIVNRFLVHTPKGAAPAPKKGLFGSIESLYWSK